MKMYEKSIAQYFNIFLVVVFFFCVCFLSSCQANCVHSYIQRKIVAATCTEEGYTEYKCSECGDKYREAIPATHTPGPAASWTDAQTCTACGTVLQDAVAYMSYAGDELAINHYLGYGDELQETIVDTRYHGTHAFGPVQYVTQNGEALPLEFNVPMQEFYTHSVLSGATLSTTDGKTYKAASGFRAAFSFTSTDKQVTDLFVWNQGLKSEFTHLGENDVSRLVKVVASYPASHAYYKTIYEIVDYSTCYIEVAKKTSSGYETVSKIDSLEAWRFVCEDGRVELTDENGALFFEAGTYRVLFKYDMIWATDTVSPVYALEDTRKANPIYPYGRLNTQYESFYVTVDESSTSVLLPNDLGEGGAFFYQLRASQANEIATTVSPYSALTFGDNIVFKMGAKLDGNKEGYWYDGKKLNGFSVTVSAYNDTKGVYETFMTVDLMAKLSADVVRGEELSWEMEKLESVREKRCKISVLYMLGEDSAQHDYYYTLKW